MNENRTKRLLAAALFGALTCATTSARAVKEPGLRVALDPNDLLALHASAPDAAAPYGAPRPGLDASQAADSSEQWTFSIAPLLWLASIDGNGGDGASPPVDIGENLSPLGSIDGGFMLAFEARAPDDRYTILADGLWVSLADDEGAVETDTDAFMLELGAGLPLTKGSAWEAIAGLRYVDLQYGTKSAGGSTDSREDWIDPWIGARGEIALGERWGLALRTDVGGFGVGTQLTWQAFGVAHFALGKGVSLGLGYRALSLDFDDDNLEYDAVIRGPQLALAFTW